ncbi:protein of unknown function [Burkholderia multivorans]
MRYPHPPPRIARLRRILAYCL